MKTSPTTARCTMGVYCSQHEFTHGGEAEELREKLEKLEAEFDDEADDCLNDLAAQSAWRDASRKIRRLLDYVDARDSCVVAGPDEDDEERYYVLSRKENNTQREVLLWWKPERKGYTAFLEHAGRYRESEVDRFDSQATVAVPCRDVEARARLMVHEDDYAALAGPRPLDSEFASWASEHGSEHLKFAMQRGHDVAAVAADDLAKALAAELGGRVYDGVDLIHWSPRPNPSAATLKRRGALVEQIEAWRTKLALPKGIELEVGAPQRFEQQMRVDDPKSILRFTGVLVLLARGRMVWVNLEASP